MIFLTAAPSVDGITCIWALEEPVEGHTTLELEFLRIAIGVGWKDTCHIVVLGERYFKAPEREETIYVVLDEATLSSPHLLFDHLVLLKDKYRAQHLFAPDQPADFCNNIQTLDGLARYMEDSRPDLALRQWPSFKDFDTTVSLHFRAAPDEQTLHLDLERLLSTEAVDPETQLPLLDKDLKTTPRLIFPVDLPVKETQAGVSHGRFVISQALWLVCTGLNWASVRRTSKKPAHEHRPGIGGY